ncbi:MAG: hypothetical protein ACRDSH_09770 [Pseudonocardiaceae bacterium]
MAAEMVGSRWIGQTAGREPVHGWRTSFTPWAGRPGWRLVEGDDEWRHGVYVNDALVTQLNGDDDAALAARRGQTVEGRPTSSSSAPGLMATMLHSLDMAAGMTVLEVGTGSGYNAALLAARLGDDAITSIELHAGGPLLGNHGTRSRCSRTGRGRARWHERLGLAGPGRRRPAP